jgi:hypothetical protein
MRLPDLNARQNRFRATPSRNRHWRIEEYLRRFRQLPLADALAQEIEQLLCSFDRKGWNNDVSPAFEGLFYRTEEFRDRRAQWFVQPVAIRGFHYDIFGVGRRRGTPQQQAAGITQVTGKQYTGRMPLLRKLQKEAGVGVAGFGIAAHFQTGDRYSEMAQVVKAGKPGLRFAVALTPRQDDLFDLTFVNGSPERSGTHTK